MLKDAPLGKTTEYIQTYTPDLLYPVLRSLAREKTSLLQHDLPFQGADIWNGYELSWLNEQGKPVIALATFSFPCATPFLVESKSFKLYLNSFNQSKFSSPEKVEQMLAADLSKAAGGDVTVEIYLPSKQKEERLVEPRGVCLDNLDIATDTYEVSPAFLETTDELVEEKLYSDLLKSNCLATGQPDWGTVEIFYKGKKINHEGLLKYIISYRNHSGFAEHCVEQFFCDLLTRCQPEQLFVSIRYTRRGGLDINPYRTNCSVVPDNKRFLRQ